MFDEHLNRQHRLTYFVRGPEWAFAVPQGDPQALQDVMRRCSTFWNGVGSLIVPVRADGRIPPIVKLLLQIRPVDRCYLHDRLGERARAAVTQVAAAAPLWDAFDRNELHPLDLLGPQERPAEIVMEVPRFATTGLHRAALAIWGYVQDDDAPYWADRYQVEVRRDEDAHGALLRGQVAGQSASPLRLAARHMGTVRQVSPTDRPHIWVIGRPTFDNLIGFWNFRARCLAQANGAPVIGLPRESLRDPGQLGALAAWLPRHQSMRMTPDVLVACPDELQSEVRAALQSLPFAEDVGDSVGEGIGVGFAPNNPPTFRFAQPMLGGEFIRGHTASALIAIANGSSSLVLPAPEGFRARSLKYTRLVLRNLPVALPITPRAAAVVHRDAQASDGVLLLTSALEPWNFDIRIPTAVESLDAWIRDHGFEFERTQDGHDADALLDRLGSVDALDALADRKRVDLLGALTPPNRDKLAAALVSEARAEAGVELDADALVERLSDVGLLVDIEARTAGDIASTIGPGTRKPDVLALLPALIEGGFVLRTREIRCPRCRFRMHLGLGELAERVRCRACGQELVLPVVDDSGRKEPDLFYRLDGLMARIMDQDVLPVLLTVRALRPAPEAGQIFFAWPGVEVSKDDAYKFDIDLVASYGNNADGTSDVWCIEVKKTATSLGRQQLSRLLEVSSALQARPGLAAMQGEFPEEFTRPVLSAGGQVLTSERLFA